MYFHNLIASEQMNFYVIFEYYGDSKIKNFLKIILTIIFILPYFALTLVKFILAIPASIPLLGLPFLLVNAIINLVFTDNLVRLMILPYYQEITSFIHKWRRHSSLTKPNNNSNNAYAAVGFLKWTRIKFEE